VSPGWITPLQNRSMDRGDRRVGATLLAIRISKVVVLSTGYCMVSPTLTREAEDMQCRRLCLDLQRDKMCLNWDVLEWL
jgi:hypothetical protein